MPPESLLNIVDAVTEAYKREVDRTLIRENLKLSPEQRVLKLIELQKFAAKLRVAGVRSRSGRR